MKSKNSLLRIGLSSGFAFALAFAAWHPGTAQAQDEMKPMNGSEHQMMVKPVNTPAEGKEMMEGKMTANRQKMMQQKQKMMEEMKAQDAELIKQVAQMNSAPSGKKIGLMAGIVTRIVEQRMAMDERKAKMEEMMQHMQMGKESMAQCPMMKSMKGMDDKSGDAHKEHQKEQN